MLHWTPKAAHSLAPFNLSQVSPKSAIAPGPSMRGDHARMLAHAALRRRRATGEDGGYWKACAPAAVAKAAMIRGQRGFPPLP